MLVPKNLIEDLRHIWQKAQQQAYQNLNEALLRAYWQIGERIVTDEQKGKSRAEYDKKTLQTISLQLSEEFGKGFSVDNLENMRRFYLTYSKSETPSRNLESPFRLSWSHYLQLIKIGQEQERLFYEIEAIQNAWSVRELKRQIQSALYVRLLKQRNPQEILALSTQGLAIQTAKDLVKDPYILEFLGLQNEVSFSENELEQAIIDKLEHFLLELGKGFTFVARQKRISIEDKHFFVDLVFYNRLLRCFVLIDLKIGELKHQDLGQIQMYVNFYDRFVKLEEENKTIGIVLCQSKNDTLVEITLPENNDQIFASRYQTVLPSKEDLQKLLNH
jgi:predicted nuclease of restriction endonuclease-like (RecB) superfamily